MMKIRTAPPNSLVAISDSDGGEVPDPSAFSLETRIISTDSCILVACFPEIEGETEIVLGPVSEVALPSKPALDQNLETPARKVAISTIVWKKLLEADVTSITTRVRIWTNSARWPDQVIVGLGDA